MWKKDETPTPAQTPQPERSTGAPAAPSATPSPTAASTPASPPRQGGSQRATIGRSISIRGDVTGDEDLLIQGRVEGSIDLQNHALTIGSEGEVNASVTGRVVVVEGSVQGDISSEEQVVLRASARVQGDITAPRVVLEDGARFRGGIDMGDLPPVGQPDKADEKKDERTKAVASSASSGNGPSADKGGADAKAEKDKGAGEGGKKKDSPELFAEARA